MNGEMKGEERKRGSWMSEDKLKMDAGCGWAHAPLTRA